MHPSGGQKEEFNGKGVEVRRPNRDDKCMDQVPGRGATRGAGALEKCVTVTLLEIQSAPPPPPLPSLVAHCWTLRANISLGFQPDTITQVAFFSFELDAGNS